MNKKWFYVLASPFAGRAEFIRAERHDDLAEAVRWMGTGVVATEDGAIVAFHESQLGFVEHVGAQVRTTRVTQWRASPGVGVRARSGRGGVRTVGGLSPAAESDADHSQGA